jgi:DNA repair protein RecO (recombination protein O)
LTLATLGQIDGTGPIAATLLAFDAQMLRLLGHAPATRLCIGCGQTVNRSRARMAFSLDNGGLVCDGCRSSQTGVVRISRSAIDVLHDLMVEVRPRQSDKPARSTDADNTTAPVKLADVKPDDVSAYPIESLLFDLSPTLTGEVRGILSRYYQRLLGRIPRMQDFVMQVPASTTS